MGGPWENYQNTQVQQSDGPWTKYGNTEGSSSSQMSFKDQLVQGAIKDPYLAAKKGFEEGTARFYAMTKGVSDIISKLSPDPLAKTIFSSASNTFEMWKKQLEESAATSPDPSKMMIPFYLAGGAIPALSQFGMLGGGASAAGLVAQGAATSALESYGNNQDIGKASVAGLEGGATMAAFPVAGNLIKGGTKIAGKAIGKVGDKLGTTHLRLVTGNEDIARDFMKNPDKYSTSIFKTPRDIAELKAEHKSYVDVVKEQLRKKELALKENIRVSAFKTQAEDVSRRTALNESIKHSSEALKTNSDDALALASEKIKESKEYASKYIQTKATLVFDEALSKYNILRTEQRTEVGLAIKRADAMSRGVSPVGFGTMDKKMQVALANSPLPVEIVRGKWVVQPRSKLKGDNAIAFQNFLDDFYSYRDKGFSVGYLENQENALKDLASSSFNKGDSSLGRWYSDLHKQFNPANLVDDLGKSHVLSPALTEIKNANAKYAKLMPQYERAMKYYFKDGVNNSKIPDIGKALTAIQTNDKSLLREMKAADMALPKEDRILPKLMDIVNSAGKMVDDEMAAKKVLKKALGEKRSALAKENRERLRELQVQIKEGKFVDSGDKIKQMQEMYENKHRELSDIIAKFDAEELFHKRQETIRSLTPRSFRGAWVVQSVLGGSALFPGVPGVLMVPALAGSPIIVANTIKGARSVGRAASKLSNVSSKVLSSPNFQKIIKSSINQ